MKLIKKKSITEKRDTDCPYELITVPIGRLLPNPSRIRKIVNDAEIMRLSENIMKNGILQPLVVRAIPGGEEKKGKKATPVLYELICGERRLRAARLVGVSELPCIVVSADDRRAYEMSVGENVIREPLGFFEEASAMASLIDVFGMTQDEASGVFGLPRAAVAAKLRLLKLTPAEKMIITNSGVTERHARALLKICDAEKRLDVLRQVVRERLNVSQTEELVDKVLCPTEEKAGRKKRVTIKDTRLIYNTLDKAIENIEKIGVPIEKTRSENEDVVEYTFRIKKPSSASEPEGLNLQEKAEAV